MCSYCDELVEAVKNENIHECERLWNIIKTNDDKEGCTKWAPRDIRDKCSDFLSYEFYLALQYLGIMF